MANQAQKYERLYTFSMEALHESIRHYSSVEKKASLHLTIFGFLLLSFIMFTQIAFQYATPFRDALDVIIIIIPAIMLIFLLITGILLVYAISFKNIGFPNLNQAMVKYFETNENEDIQRDITNQNIKTVEDNYFVARIKTKYIKISQVFTGLTTLTFLAGILLLTVQTLRYQNYSMEKKMNNEVHYNIYLDDDDDPPPPSEEPTELPGPRIEQEGAQPGESPEQQIITERK